MCNNQVPKGAAAQQNEFERLTWELQQLKEKPKEAERKLARLERALAHDIHVSSICLSHMQIAAYPGDGSLYAAACYPVELLK